MKTLIIYDNNGTVYYQAYGDVIAPESVNAAVVDIPDGKTIDHVDGATGEVILKDVEKTDTEVMKEQISAIYTKMSEGYAGTAENPIPWVYGMECKEGVYYSYNGEVYKIAKGGYMNPCVWTPDCGIWQFEKV